MKNKFAVIGAVILLAAFFVPPAKAQVGIFKGLGVENRVKVGPSGEAVAIVTANANATSGAASVDADIGVITTESLSTAAGAIYTLTITDNLISAASKVTASIAWGTNSQGLPMITRVTPGANSLVILVQNMHATLALNGTLKVTFAEESP